jgi:hypothetical protein
MASSASKPTAIDARISREVCEVARTFALPVLCDVENELHVVDWLARDYPDVRFIIPHLSSFAENWRAQTAFLERLESCPNIHADSSGVRFFDVLARAVECCGPEKILFGSDGPWLHPGLELAKIRALGLPSVQEQLILGGNFLRLTGLKAAPAFAANLPAAVPPGASAGFGRSRSGGAPPVADYPPPRPRQAGSPSPRPSG